MDDCIKRAQYRAQKLEKNPPPANLQGDLTRPHLRKMLKCKDLGRAAEITAPWLPPKHGMELKKPKKKPDQSAKKREA